MRTISLAIASTAVLAILSLPALSQGFPRDEERGRGYDRGYGRDDGMMGRRYDGRGRDERGDRSDGGAGRGSSFQMKIGDTNIDVKCDPRETLRDCVDAATTLLDKSRSMTSTAGPNPASTGSPPKP